MNKYREKTGWGNYFEEIDSIHHDSNSIKEFNIFTDQMNLIRGFDIRDHVPELNQL